MKTQQLLSGLRQTSEEFTVTSGVQQGCVLAPTLFNLYSGVATRMAMDDHQMQGRGVSMAYLHDAKLVGNRKTLQLETIIADLEYADDMALVADSWDHLKAMLDTVAECCRGLGFSISCKMTKTMAILPDLFSMPEPVYPSLTMFLWRWCPTSNILVALFWTTVVQPSKLTPEFAKPQNHSNPSIASSGTSGRSSPVYAKLRILLMPSCCHAHTAV